MSTCIGCCECLRGRVIHCMKYNDIWTFENGRAATKEVPCTQCFKVFQDRSETLNKFYYKPPSEENFYYKMKAYEELENARRNLETAKKHIVSQDIIHYDSPAALCFRIISAAYDALKKIHDHYAKHLGADIE